MENIFDYLKVLGDKSFSEVSFNEYDGFIFSRLSYIRFPVNNLKDYYKDLNNASMDLFSIKQRNEIFKMKDDFLLLKEVISVPRYRSIVIRSIINEFSEEQNEQFFAICFFNNDKKAKFNIVSFRGTDGTAVGWKEDFDFCYKQETFAQADAAKFVKNVLPWFDSFKTYIVGHSKGGNLAIYAAASLKYSLQKKIGKIFTFDSPGFNPLFYKNTNFENIKNKIQGFAPESSVIGRIMDTHYAVKIVKSKTLLLLQHNIYNRKFNENGFEFVDSFSRRSNVIKNYVDNKIKEMTIDQRKDLVSKIYVMINTMEIDGMLNLDPNPIKLANRMRKLRKDFPEFKDALSTLFDTKGDDEELIQIENKEKNAWAFFSYRNIIYLKLSSINSFKFLTKFSLSKISNPSNSIASS